MYRLRTPVQLNVIGRRRRLELNQLYLSLISALIVCESRNKNRITISPCKPHKWINDQKPSQATYYYLGQSIATTKNWEPAGFQWHSSPDILVVAPLPLLLSFTYYSKEIPRIPTTACSHVRTSTQPIHTARTLSLIAVRLTRSERIRNKSSLWKQ